MLGRRRVGAHRDRHPAHRVDRLDRRARRAARGRGATRPAPPARPPRSPAGSAGRGRARPGSAPARASPRRALARAAPRARRLPALRSPRDRRSRPAWRGRRRAPRCRRGPSSRRRPPRLRPRGRSSPSSRSRRPARAGSRPPGCPRRPRARGCGNCGSISTSTVPSDAHELSATTTPSSPSELPGGQIRSRRGRSLRERVERLAHDRRLGAGAADPADQPPVRRHDAAVAAPGRGRPPDGDDRREHERRALGGEPAGLDEHRPAIRLARGSLTPRSPPRSSPPTPCPA